MSKKEIEGLANVMANLNKEINAIKGRTMGGLLEGAVIIRYDMDKTEPKIPIDTGNLRASWFTSPLKKLSTIALLIGFSANYAIFVHELVDKVGKLVKWNRPGSGPKFFEASIKRNTKQVLEAIQRNAKIPK